MSSSLQHKEMIPASPAPVQNRGVVGWLLANLFKNPMDSIVTIVLLGFIVVMVLPLWQWLFANAVWSGEDRSVCTTVAQGGIQPDGWSGACWAFVHANFSQFIYGNYPVDERWRVNVMALIVVIINIPLLMPSVGHKFLNAACSLFVVPFIGYFLLFGGYFGLEKVETALWGGLMVTLIIAYTSITISLPLGILLALGRRSESPLIKLICVIFIETLRGIPLVAILFIASVMLPIFLPNNWTFDKFLRALIGVALFTSVYIAEVIRGGLQAVPKSQYEAAHSLGFGYWYTMILIVLPQAIRLVIPGIINTLIGMFKETSLVYIISMFDLLGKITQLSQQASWITPQTPATAYVFAAFVFWIFCFSMSRYAHYIENRSKQMKFQS